MKILVAEKLSEHRYKTPEGYLICVDSILARTGKQTYKRSEIFGDDDERLVEVDRKAEDVFSPETMASFENKPICVEHPDVDVNSGNISEFAVGFVRDIHKGEYEGEPVMLGTLVITDAKTVEEIEEGKHTDLSCGYDCDIDDSENPQQRNIRGNHVALCEQGRAGIARIMDSVKDEESTYTEVTKNLEKEAKKDMSWLDAVVKDSKRITDFDDTPRNVRVVKEFIEKNGNKFSKSKDADAILEYIKMKTGIRNADYGDVLYIIKEYTRAEITDSVKDAQQTFRVLALVPGDYDDEPGFDIIFNVKANSENEAIIKAKKYAEKTPAYKFAWDFRIAKSNQRARIERNVDSVKDEQLYAVEFTYNGDSWSDYLGHVNVRAKSEQEALTKAKRWAREHYDNAYNFKIGSTKYTNVETIDVIKDAKYVIMHPRKNLYLTVGAKTWSDESSPMIKKFDSEKEAEEYAKKNTSDFRIAVFDSVKDAMFEYIFNYHDTYHGTRDKMRVNANNLDEAIREFGKTMALGGFGTANIYVVSVSPNDGYMRAYGKLSEMLKQKWTRDSAKTLDSKKLLSIVRAVKSIKSNDAKETKLTFTPTNDVINIDMTNTLIDKLVSSGIDYHSAKKNAGKYSIVIIGDNNAVHKAKLVIENSGFFSKWS